MDYSLHPDSARKPLVDADSLTNSEAEVDWQENMEGVPELGRTQRSSGIRSYFDDLFHRRSSSRGAIFLENKFSNMKRSFGKLTSWKIKTVHVYIVFLSLLLLGTIACFGIHVSHDRRKSTTGEGDFAQRSHGHRYVKGHCLPSTDPEGAESPEFVIIQANDIYELGPYIYEGENERSEKDALAGSDVGGLSKLCALKKAYQSKYGKQKVLAVLSGDYLSPSAMSTAKIPTNDITSLQKKHGRDPSAKDAPDFVDRSQPGQDVRSLAGAHMVSVGNKIFDIATFGNHEFDLSKRELNHRIEESWFPWISSNVRFRGNSTKNVFSYRLREAPPVASSKCCKTCTTSQRGLRMAFISATMENFPVPSYVQIMNTAETKVELIRLTRFLRSQRKVDFIVMLTHQSLAADIALIKAFGEEDGLRCNGVNLVLGGHEHESSYGVIGKCAVPLTKSFYNAKAVYVHKIFADSTPKGELKFHVESEFVALDGECPDDSHLNKEITDWWGLAAEAFRKDDLDLKRSVAYLPIRHDLRSELIYTARTALAVHIADALVHCCESQSIDGAIFNTGAIRLDNFIGPGVFSVYDVIRVWPYEDQIELIKINGATVRRIIETSNLVNRGTHGFLQLSSEFSDACMRMSTCGAVGDSCTISGNPIEDDRVYTMALPAYLLEGKQENLEFLEEYRTQGAVSKNRIEKDVRHCLTSYLPIHFPLPE
ncbi:hypothetical protein XU18_0597 [Perkinsela sp. CCAP 1560/4]|nr:hypothetical protein XU18_1197 [Perkinsela sp. CCAP 1560/4]KNH09177.1 hypothetical protein XU18_0597 [Perkinsela sp. CCAP 1560/4]|eukprot:KNH08189.1 hypothetical protein XU18_1197 [Perkinsela sp. CCAP 1560/4]